MEGKQQQEPTIEELISKISLMKQALEFYGAEHNYTRGQIEKDQGHQARFALQQIEKIDKYNQDILDDVVNSIDINEKYEINSNQLGAEFQDKLESINKIIQKYKKDGN